PATAAIRADAAVEHAVAAALRTRVVDLQRDVLVAAVVRFRQREVERRLEIFALLRPRARGTRLRSARRTLPDVLKEHVEEIREAAALAERRVEAARIRTGRARTGVARTRSFLCGALPIAAENVVLAALVGIAENLVGLLDVLEFFLGFFGVVRIRVRM